MRDSTLDTEAKMPHDVSDSPQRRGAGQSTPHSPRLSPMPNEIPLYTHDQRFVGMIGEAEAARIAGRVDALPIRPRTHARAPACAGAAGGARGAVAAGGDRRVGEVGVSSPMRTSTQGWRGTTASRHLPMNPPPHVLFLRNLLKVVWINTDPIAAKVINYEPDRELSLVRGIGKMRSRVAEEDGVSSTGFGGCPLPAPVTALIDLRHEALEAGFGYLDSFGSGWVWPRWEVAVVHAHASAAKSTSTEFCKVLYLLALVAPLARHIELRHDGSNRIPSALCGLQDADEHLGRFFVVHKTNYRRFV